MKPKKNEPHQTKNNTIIRVLTGLTLGPLFLVMLFVDVWYSIPLFVTLIAAMVIGLRELHTMHKMKGIIFSLNIAAFLGIIFISLFYVYYLHSSYPEKFLAFSKIKYFLWEYLFLASLIAIFFTFIQQIFLRPLEHSGSNVSLTFFSVFYIAIPIALIFMLKANASYGNQAVLLAAVSSFIADTGAFFIGKNFGKHKANISASPNKTWEGFAGGIFFNILGMLLVTYLFQTFFDGALLSYFEALILGGVLAISGQVGDLAESSFKRSCQIKDSGKVIPGHGGILDLVDAALVNIPALFVYLKIFRPEYF